MIHGINGSSNKSEIINIMKERRQKKCNLLVVLAVMVALPIISSCAGNRTMTDHPKTIDALIKALIVATPPLDRATVEHLTGAKLKYMTSTGAFNLYKTYNLKLEDTTIELIEYREPMAGGEAEAGPLLILDLADSCVNFKDILSRYDAKTMTDVPSVEAIDGEWVLARMESWGKISFGALASSLDCLKSFAISIETPPKN